jgi:hypothetical protein
MARQYIEPMLATRRSNAWADPAAELAQVLRQAGASAVEAWVVARTPRPGE